MENEKQNPQLQQPLVSGSINLSKEEKLSNEIKNKMSELNELISKANEFDLNVQITQAMRENKNKLTLWSQCGVSVYKVREPIWF